MQIAKKITLYILSLGIIFLFATYLHFDNSKTFENILTFLSVTIGFSITALSIIATSSFAKDLYKQEAPKDNSKTLLHQLVGKFSNATIAFALAITLILIYSFIEPIELKSFEFWQTKVSLKSILSGIIWYLTFLSIWLFIDLIKLFAKFVIQSAKRQ
ncbi:MAG: hypothetical protein RIR12_1211 [Bacteroidota bacterium]|jgi:hypothetical protein